MSITQVIAYLPFLLFIFLLGSCIGSFINVWSDRLPGGKSLLGFSHCDYCQKQLSLFDLLPIFSFLLLKGKCRYCQKKLSIQYPLVEFFTGSIFAFYVFKHYLLTNELINVFLLPSLLICSILITILIIDYQNQIIPDELLIGLLIIICLFFPTLIFTNLLGALGGMSFFLIIYLLTKGRAMGYGDVKLVFILGLLLSPMVFLKTLYLAFLTGGAVSAILLLSKKANLKTAIAFGPFIIISFLLFF